MKQFVKSIIRKRLVLVITFAVEYPTLKLFAISLVRKFPRLEARLRKLHRAGAGFSQVLPEAPSEISQLTPTARRIYTSLQTARAKRSVLK